MKTIDLSWEDLKPREDLGEDWYEWGGIDEEANVYLPGCRVVLSVGALIDTGGGYLDTGGGDLRTGGGYLRCGTLYWRRMDMPQVGGQMSTGKIRPTAHQRAYWEDRLGVELPGCWGEIEKKIALMLPELLKRECWTPTERWILESYR